MTRDELVDLIDAELCSPECVFGGTPDCECRCNGKYHGLLREGHGLARVENPFTYDRVRTARPNRLMIDKCPRCNELGPTHHRISEGDSLPAEYIHKCFDCEYEWLVFWAVPEIYEDAA